MGKRITKSDYEVYEHHVAFYGSGAVFSNFFPCKFKLDGKTWISSEQYFMAQKAEYFGDEEMYERIFKTDNPRDAKKLGRQVKGYNDEEWSKVREEKMYKGVYAKFSQNKDLKEFLLSEEFNGKDFVEGSPIDGIWGVKLNWDNPSIDDENNWDGLNLLGKVINRVRENLK